MNKGQFIIRILDLYWIDGNKDNPDDLCLHGDVYVKIGDEVLAEKYSCTVSSTALYLLKSIEDNHIYGERANQMLPCCGFFIIPSENDETVEITGCPSGIDWTVLHDGDYVKLISEKGNKVLINLREYREIVYSFVDEVEDFYQKSTAKNIPTDDFDRKGYIKFWKEMRNRRTRNSLEK